LHVDLQEGAGQFLPLPRCSRLAGAQADDHVLHPDCLSWFQRQVADDAVALVQQPDDSDPFGHRRHAGLVGGRARHFDGHGIPLRWSLVAPAAAGDCGNQRQDQRGPLHYWSGVQAL
jgi:hypothetical protein